MSCLTPSCTGTSWPSIWHCLALVGTAATERSLLMFYPVLGVDPVLYLFLVLLESCPAWLRLERDQCLCGHRVRSSCVCIVWMFVFTVRVCAVLFSLSTHTRLLSR